MRDVPTEDVAAGSSLNESQHSAEKLRNDLGDSGGDAEDRPQERVASAAALAIADQIMGLESSIAANRDLRIQALRTSDGSLTPIGVSRIIGRQEGDGRLIIPDGRVSRSHAVVASDRGRVTVRDLGSSNGTYLVRDGTSERVGAEPVELRVGDRLATVGGFPLAEVMEVDP